MRLLRELLLMAGAGWLTWWLLLVPRPAAGPAPPAPAPAPSLRLQPRTLNATAPAPEASAAAPAPESGTPEGEKDRPPRVAEEEQGGDAEEAAPEEATGESTAAAAPEEAAEEAVAEAEDPPPDETPGSAAGGETAAADEVRQVMEDAGLRSQARRELAGEASQGFATTILARPEDELDLARFFGERIVMIPKQAFGSEDPWWYGLDLATGEIRRHDGAPPLAAVQQAREYRSQYIDQGQYPRLPDAIRAFRRSFLGTSWKDIYFFGALLSEAEWALVIARRQKALAAAPDPTKPVRRFVLAYRRLDGGAFDLQVRRIEFADGSTFQPPQP